MATNIWSESGIHKAPGWEGQVSISAGMLPPARMHWAQTRAAIQSCSATICFWSFGAFFLI